MTVSSFPLYLHVEQGSAFGDISSMPVKPKWVKVFAPIHCTEVKQSSGGESKTLLRFQAMSESSRYIEDGVQGGRNFVLNAVQQIGSHKANVDALEFLNEQTSFEDSYWLRKNNEAGLGFVEECVRQGLNPVLHNGAVANPRPDLVYLLKDSINAAISSGGYFGTHCYGPKILFDQKELYVECYLEQINRLRQAGINVPNDRVFITEFSYDYLSSYRDSSGKNTSGAWKKIGVPVQELKDRFSEYAVKLKQLNIQGAFMYNFFGYQGDQYELKEIMDWYKDILQSFAPVPPPIGRPEYVKVKPGGVYQSAYLRNKANETDGRAGWSDRGTRVHVIDESNGYYKIETWIPKSLTEPSQ